jgi:hypothetical protein
MEVKYGARTVKKTAKGYEYNALLSSQGQITIPDTIRIPAQLEKGDILQIIVVKAVGRRAQ